MKANDRKTPVLTRLVEPSELSVSDLSDSTHPVNDSSASGKTNGMACLIGSDIYLASGSDPEDTWVKFSSQEGSEPFPSGWAVYNDTQYTSGSPLVVTSGTTVAIPNNAGTKIETFLPSDGALYDETAGRVNMNTLGSHGVVRVTFTASASLNNGGFSVSLDISAAGDGSITVATDPVRMLRGSNVPSQYTVALDVYALDTFIANGGRLRITAEAGDITLYGIGFYIAK